MRAVLVERFGARPEVTDVPDPVPAGGEVVLRVEATGLCRSDWHGWQGHDPGIAVPYVPGHELAGVIEAAGAGVRGWRPGDRVTVPFICACGSCPPCRAGQQQVCLHQEQPGFTRWGSFAEYVAIPRAQHNLIALPAGLSWTAAASLGCRLATAYRAVRSVGRAVAGEWMAVFGCGGVGLSAVMIGAAAGTRVIAVDVSQQALALARRHGAEHAVPAGDGAAEQIRQLTGGGAQLTVDAAGSGQVAQAALRSLRPRGRHVQAGLLVSPVRLDASPLIAGELQWLGSHGMAAHEYPALLAEVGSGALRPADLVTRIIGLDEVPAALAAMSSGGPAGMTVIEPGRPGSAP
jgi:D-arabinose 1-dehydrogenase-like Zn-dependent alcohol dehydrogenase